MSSQHKAPLAAFFVVSIACIVVVVNALRGDANALNGFLSRPIQSVVASVSMIPQTHEVLQAETGVVSGAKAGLATVPTVVAGAIDQVSGPAAAQEPVVTAPAGHGHTPQAPAAPAAVGAAPQIVTGHVPGPPAHAVAHGYRDHGTGADHVHQSIGQVTHAVPSFDAQRSAPYVGHGSGHATAKSHATNGHGTKSHRQAKGKASSQGNGATKGNSAAKAHGKHA